MFEECLYFNSNALARTVSRIWTDAYSPFDLTPPHAFLLRLVLAKPGLKPRELADELSLSRSTVTRFVDSLETRGYLMRRSETPDARERQVYPTIQAQELQTELELTGKRLTAKMKEAFGQDVVAQLVREMRAIQSELA